VQIVPQKRWVSNALKTLVLSKFLLVFEICKTMTTKQLHINNTPEAIEVFTDGDASVLTLTKGDIEAAERGGNEPLTTTKTKSNSPVDERTIINSAAWSPWGDNDDFPIRLLQKLDYLGVMKTALDLNADMHYGAGLVWVKDRYEDGKVIYDVQQLPGWRQWMRDSGYAVTHGELIDSLEIFYIAFPEVILGEDGKVASVRVLETPRCRFEKRDASGRINKIYYNVHPDVPKNKVTEIPIWDAREPKKYKRFVYPVMYRTFGKIYYPEPNYYATFRAGWADVAISVAKFMKNVYLNSMNLKYHLKIPLSSMKAKYKEWDEKSEAEQLKLLVDYKEMWDTKLADAENAGKSIFSLYDDLNEGKTVEIEPIKNYLDSARELPTNLAANSEMLFSANTDPAQVGMNNPGGGDLNGSGGSDKRESRKLKQSNLYRERTVSLQLLNLISFLNGWDAEVYPKYMDTDTSQTMDQSPTGKQNVLT
jgi:hypothetical protein